jgi:hypothetical protein
MSMTKDNQWLRGWLVTAVIMHCVVALWHGAADITEWPRTY